MSTRLRLPLVEQIDEKNTRQSLEFMRDFLNADPMLRGQYQMFDLKFDKFTTGSSSVQVLTQELPHGLGFIPNDIIMTKVWGTRLLGQDAACQIFFNFEAFTNQNYSVTAIMPYTATATPTITTTINSEVATVSSASNLYPGQRIVSANIPQGTFIVWISGTTIYMSKRATAGAAGTAASFTYVPLSVRFYMGRHE
jgi:hypothetical protein